MAGGKTSVSKVFFFGLAVLRRGAEVVLPEQGIERDQAEAQRVRDRPGQALEASTPYAASRS